MSVQKETSIALEIEESRQRRVESEILSMESQGLHQLSLNYCRLKEFPEVVCQNRWCHYQLYHLYLKYNLIKTIVRHVVLRKNFA